MKKIDVRDALQLEEYEQTMLKNRTTRRAIQDTYGRKQHTKFRRKLPNGRKWKNKEKHYEKIEGQMAAREFNLKQKASKVIEKIYKEKAIEEAKARRKHSIID